MAHKSSLSHSPESTAILGVRSVTPESTATRVCSVSSESTAAWCMTGELQRMYKWNEKPLKYLKAAQRP